MDPIFYEVTATFQNSKSADAWVQWLRDKHIADVVAAGATRGRVIRLDDPPHTCSAQYEFRSRAEFDAYLRDHAPRLRAEGLQIFSADAVTYSRRSGPIVS